MAWIKSNTSTLFQVIEIELKMNPAIIELGDKAWNIVVALTCFNNFNN